MNSEFTDDDIIAFYQFTNIAEDQEKWDVENLNKDEIGRIDVKDHYSFAAVSRKKIKQTLNLIRNEKIKGIKTLIEEAK